MGCSGCPIGSTTNPGGNYVGVRLADAEDGKTTLVFTADVKVKKGEHIIVEAEAGPEFAEVTTTSPLVAKACSSKKAKRFLRFASDSEYADYVDRLELQDRAFRLADDKVREKSLDLRLVKAQVGFDRRKVLLLYTADKRVEVRDLCRDVSNELKLRVEARMMGVRDETKLMGGVGSCGLSLCCSTWLKSFHPVTIRMVKLQGATPNPSKLTGTCGRLKCCVAYELEGGIEAARRLGAAADRERGERAERGERGERGGGSPPPPPPPPPAAPPVATPPAEPA